MLIKGKGLFPARGHEWEFVTHVDHNESSLRGHNVEPRVLYSPSPSPPRFSRATFPRIRRVHEQEETFLSPVGDFLVGLDCRRAIHSEVATDPTTLFSEDGVVGT